MVCSLGPGLGRMLDFCVMDLIRQWPLNNFGLAVTGRQYHCAEQIEYTILRFYNYTLEAAIWIPEIEQARIKPAGLKGKMFASEI